jgi:hypothetical protein
VPGQADRYSVVSGTSSTPSPVPGLTVRYSVRTAVEGSAWASEVSVSYPVQREPSPPAAPEPSPSITPNLQPGLNSGSDAMGELQAASLLGAKLVRIEWPIGSTTAEMEPVIAAYAAKGIRVLPLAGFYQTVPTVAQARNLANWAKTFGPGGAFWAGRPDGQLAVSSIEFGNETQSFSQYGDRPGEPSYMTRAETYATRLREAAEAIRAAGSSVGLLAQEENWSGDWIRAMYKAVPNLTHYVAGWTIHPYGGEQYNRERLEALIAQTAEHGAAGIPIDVTEWGLSTDNGHCLASNEGWNRCMPYEEAAQIARRTVAWIGKLLGSRLRDFILYKGRDQKPSGATTNIEDYYGALQHDLQPKGAYTTEVQALLGS